MYQIMKKEMSEIEKLKKWFLTTEDKIHSFGILSDSLLIPMLALLKRFSECTTYPDGTLVNNVAFPTSDGSDNILKQLDDVISLVENEYASWPPEYSNLVREEFANFPIGRTELKTVILHFNNISFHEVKYDHQTFEKAFNLYLDLKLSNLRNPVSISPFVTRLVAACGGLANNENIYLLDYSPSSYLDFFGGHKNQTASPNITMQSVYMRRVAFEQTRSLASPKTNIRFCLSNFLTDPIKEKSQQQVFDLSIGNLLAPPSKMMIPDLEGLEERFEFGINTGNKSEYLAIQHLISTTQKNGKAIALCFPRVLFGSGNEAKIREKLVESDLIDAVILLPKGTVLGTNVCPILLIFNKNKEDSKKQKTLFIDAQSAPIEGQWDSGIASSLYASIYRNYLTRPHKSRLVELAEIRANNYNLAVNLYADDSVESNLIREIIDQQDGYDLTDFSDENLVLEISKVKSKDDILKEIEGQEEHIYMPNISNMKPVCHLLDFLENRKTKPDRYFKVKLNKNVLDPKFAEYFFQSELGKLFFSKCGKGATIPHISLASLKECKIAIPKLEIQKSVLQAAQKLDRLSSMLEDYKAEMAIRPTNVHSMSTKLDDMLTSVEQLSEEETVLSILRHDESKTLEFKQTFSLNLHSKQKDKEIENACMKTIGAFLNMEGGDLLIGVSDDKEIVGIDDEMLKFHKNSKDNFLKHFKNRLETSVGAQNYPYIDQRLVSVEGKSILWVRCIPSPNEVWVDGKVFYVRTNPATDKLEGPALAEYIRNNFPR